MTFNVARLDDGQVQVSVPGDRDAWRVRIAASVQEACDELGLTLPGDLFARFEVDNKR